MNVITTFKEKRQAKQIAFERKILRELSLTQLRDSVNTFFSSFFYSKYIYATAIEDGSIDIAIESYLLGASMSRFGFFGESEEQVKERCRKEEKYLIDALFDYLLYWGAASGNDFQSESLYLSCDEFVSYWWIEGFQKGEMRYRLRLH